MDTSKEYIKMCEKAVEVQVKAYYREGDWIYFGDKDGIVCLTYRAYCEGRERGIVFFMMTKDLELICESQPFPEEVSVGKGEYKLRRYCNPVWLPRQDQLQDILADLDNSGFYTQLDQFKHVLDMSIQEIGHGLTYEKLWLKVVMRKFNKTWNGNDWEE